MKIGRKIALFYTLVTVLTTMAVIGVFYLFSSRYIDGLYRSYLREKAFLTAQKHWERDEVDEQSYQTIQRKYDELLPEAKEILLDMDSDAVVRDTLNKYLSASQQKQLLESKEMSSVSFVYQDMLGLFSDFTPKFVKKYANVGEMMTQAFRDYIADVQEGSFPAPEHTFAISEDVIKKLY